MRSARILFAATAAAGTLALAAPGAYAITSGDWDKEDSSHSRDHDKPHGGMHTGSGALSLVDADDWSKDEHGKKDDHGKKDHDKPHGGVHTGGGALTTVSGDEWSKEHGKGGKHEKDHDKPKGGMHTGSGALSLVNADDWSKDKDKEQKDENSWSKENQKEEGGSKHEKPKGGMHTGGGGLTNSGTSLTGALVLAGAAGAFVLYRRRQGAGSAA
ncbi:hypothetical protein ACF064_06880 [Streptomyces sp. NPDC015492]|uniref:hypothetical protein n=1 Tax=Streptomyces sp. NPDC015492 TaxID=3364958 RepID=UPI0036F7683E